MLKGRHKEIFEVICKYIEENGFSPTVREIGDTVGLKSSGTVQ